jgi:hypothetical protein
MTRVKQFADDLGISKNQAKNLINKGRSRKDGGSQILESVMKPKEYLVGGSVASSVKKDAKKIKKTNKKPKDPMGKRFSDDGEFKMRPKAQAPYHPKFNPDQYHPKLNPKGTKGKPKGREAGGQENFGMLSVKAGIDKNPKATQADRIAGATMKEKTVNKAKGGGMAIQGLGFKGVK